MSLTVLKTNMILDRQSKPCGCLAQIFEKQAGTKIASDHSDH